MLEVALGDSVRASVKAHRPGVTSAKTAAVILQRDVQLFEPTVARQRHIKTLVCLSSACKGAMATILPPRACLVALLLTTVAAVEGANDDHEFVVAGYLPEWRYEGANFDTLSRHLTHLIFFSAEPTATGGISGLDRLPRQELMSEARAAATKHQAELLVCFGGWLSTTCFAAAHTGAK